MLSVKSVLPSCTRMNAGPIKIATVTITWLLPLIFNVPSWPGNSLIGNGRKQGCLLTSPLPCNWHNWPFFHAWCSIRNPVVHPATFWQAPAACCSGWRNAPPVAATVRQRPGPRCRRVSGRCSLVRAWPGWPVGHWWPPLECSQCWTGLARRAVKGAALRKHGACLQM